MRNLLHNLVAHPLHGLLWWAGLHSAALAVHMWWAPEPAVRHFHVAYGWCQTSGATGLDVGDIALHGRDLVTRELINTWRRIIARQLAPLAEKQVTVVILGWQEYEAGKDWA